MWITIEGTARQAGALRTHATKGHLRPRETTPALWLAADLHSVTRMSRSQAEARQSPTAT